MNPEWINCGDSIAHVMTDLHLLKRPVTPSPVRVPDPSDDPGDVDAGGRIRCPQCAWEPGREDRWSCSCRHVWNTFETRGVCPACEKQWADTQCLRCLAWSPHDDWYEG
jgi:hypothetical protein